MDVEEPCPDSEKILREILGYLNFSSGKSDPQFLANVNKLYGRIDAVGRKESPAHDEQTAEPTWRELGRVLGAALERVAGRLEAFREVRQAEVALRLVFQHLLPAYKKHHRDLLFHQNEEALFGPFFIGRVCEAVLSEGGPWDESDRITQNVLKRLNDFVGHRPVAVLRTEQKLQPYDYEWVRPIPLWIRGAGVAVGPYHDLIQKVLEILRATDRSLLGRAWFDLELLDELALDPRAYDFEHPVNRRPNYHFGQWDPHHIDNQGRYRRFVLEQVTLEAVLSRIEHRESLPYEEALLEAAAVSAGTILMGSGVSGSGPDSHDSNTTLATLLPRIAAYRDAFYQQLLERLPGEHGRRLRAEAATLQQPLGGARQHLNQELARRRADQLQHVHLAQLFARMGYSEAALRQAHVVPVASARLTCEIRCRLSTAHLAIDSGQLDRVPALILEIEDILHRAIECGALVDPWNILGFGGQFSLFPALENSIRDHRVDELIDLISAIFSLYARLQKEAAAAGQTGFEQSLSDNLRALARWWDKFATVEVSTVDGVSGRQASQSAARVATTLGAWHKAGTAAGDVAFWREQVERFQSPEAYALIVEALLDKRDLVASMALLMQWLSRAEVTPLAEGDYSFHTLALRWMEDLWHNDEPADRDAAANHDRRQQRWALTRKFLEHLEANAEDLWQVPQLELHGRWCENGSSPDGLEEADEPDNLFSAAYENVTYRDSAEDGFEGEILDGAENPTDFELSAEAERINRRLVFLRTLARLWELAAAASTMPNVAGTDRDEVLAGWLARATENRRHLLALLAAVHRYRIPPPENTHDSLVEYDQHRAIKEMLLERIITTYLKTTDSARLICATSRCGEAAGQWADWEAPVQRVLRAIYRGEAEEVRGAWPDLLDALAQQPLLYVPAAKGGTPRRIVASRSVQQVLRRLLGYLPRLGLLYETCQLIETIQHMEQDHPAGPGAITEFDEMFQIGYQAIVRCLVASSEDHAPAPADGLQPAQSSDVALVDCLEQTAEPLLYRWLAHSRNIRLSVLETLKGENRWQALVQFIRRYGDGLFTQRFMNFGNLRAILHQGVGSYLKRLEEMPEADDRLRLLADLDGPLSRDDAIRWMEVIVEAVVENYAEYMDYNSTTTQSDRGDMLYTLLDFLRLLASYDRIAWNLQPLVSTHDVLVRCGRTGAAELWQQAIAERTSDMADDHLHRFEELSRKYGMRLPSIADRLGERFVQPLAIDRLRALVGPAMEELKRGGPTRSFRLLEKGISDLTRQPAGVGFEVPSWLDALEEEVDRLQAQTREDQEPLDPYPPVAQVRLPLDQLQLQLDRIRH